MQNLKKRLRMQLLLCQSESKCLSFLQRFEIMIKFTVAAILHRSLLHLRSNGYYRVSVTSVGSTWVIGLLVHCCEAKYQVYLLVVVPREMYALWIQWEYRAYLLHAVKREIMCGKFQAYSRYVLTIRERTLLSYVFLYSIEISGPI